LGYVAAANVVEATTRPPRNAEVRPEFIEHLLLLNELFVGLAEAPLKRALANRIAEIPRRRHRSAMDGLYANARTLAFTWIPSDSVRLPWKEYRDGNSWDRIILPDAVLELPKLRRRIFLECETGTHTIVPRGFHKPGSTLGKAVRYESFICELADFDSKITFYQRQYPDRFAPEVYFLVPRPERADSINRALTQWAAQRQGRWELPRALTISDAIQETLTTLGQWSPEIGPRHARVPLGASVGVRDVRLLHAFFDEAVGTLKKVRAEARQRNEVPPSYPTTMEEMRKLLEQLWKSAKVVA